MSRGVIAAPAIINIEGDGFTMERGLSPQEIRYYALYWDRVVIPGNNLIYVGLPDEELLIESGVIERPRVVFQGSFDGAEFGHAFAEAQSEVAKKLIEEEKSIDWVLHQIGNKLNIPREYTEPKHSLRFELINLLPVPEAEVAIPDILEFKERRASELAALHQTIEAAYIEALKNPDPDLGSAVAIRALKASIENLNLVTNERWEKTTRFDFSAEFNLDGGKFVQAVAGGAAFDFFTNAFTLPVGTLAGGIVSLFNLRASYGASFKPAANNTTRAFLSHASDEGIIGE
jgi:hypothetical protein